jgi:TusA-related sulfurtransferase
MYVFFINFINESIMKTQKNAATSLQSSNSLKVTFTNPQDTQRVLCFYEKNRHEHVDLRQDSVWNERTQNGRVVLVEDSANNIGLISVAYDFFDANQQALQTQFINAVSGGHDGNAAGVDIQPRWIEIGSTIALQDKTAKPNDLLKGLNLYPFIIASQTIHEFIAHTPQDFILANVNHNNPSVITMLNEKVGWKFFEPIIDIIQANKSTKADTGAYKIQRTWLRATPDTLPHQARLILSVIDEGNSLGLHNKKTEARIALDTSNFALAQEFRKTVEAIAHGPISQILEQQKDMDMKSAHALVMGSLEEPATSTPEQANYPIVDISP